MRHSVIIFGSVFVAAAMLSVALYFVASRHTCMAAAATAKVSAEWSVSGGCVVLWHGLRLPVEMRT